MLKNIYVYQKTIYMLKKYLCVEKNIYVEKNMLENKDYFLVGECVRFLFTSCEGSLTNE